MKARTFIAAGFLFAVLSGQIRAGLIVHTSDFINDANRTHFNGFESIPNDGTYYLGGAGPYIEDTIQVQHVTGVPGDFNWVTFNSWSGFQGNYGWFPLFGDGYSEITLSGGVDFDSVGFNIGTGFSDGVQQYLYELLDNNVVVLSGAVPGTSGYLGFSGGGFDKIRFRDSIGGGGTVTDGGLQLVTLDNIETFSNINVVPEPTAGAIWCFGALGVILAKRLRRKSNAASR